MSGVATCPVRDGSHRHVVTKRNYNNSAFNGWRRTWSRYSQVLCLGPVGSDPWPSGFTFYRTAASYVDTLPDATPDDWRAIGVDSARID